MYVLDNFVTSGRWLTTYDRCTDHKADKVTFLKLHDKLFQEDLNQDVTGHFS